MAKDYSEPAQSPQTGNAAFWYDPQKRSFLYQLGVLLMVGLLVYYLVSNTIANLERQAIATGFGFLEKEASFEIGESVIPYSAADRYARALMVGVLNTLLVSFIGIILTVILGTFVGIARLSTNWLVAKLAAVYIEVFQDIPVLLQLFFWYALFYEMLPSPRQAVSPFAGVFLSNRGLVFAVPQFQPTHAYMGISFLAGCIAIYFLRRWARERQAKTGKIFPVFRVSVGILLLFPFITWLVGGAPTAMSVPELKGFNFQGGVNVSPEFAALLLGLVLYTAAFVAEAVRAGIQSVSKGQREAAMSIGLKTGHVLQLVILPQALRVIIPPLTGNLVAMLKDTAVASVVAAPELLKRARELYTSKTNPTPLVAAALIYLAVLIPLVRAVNMLENRLKK